MVKRHGETVGSGADDLTDMAEFVDDDLGPGDLGRTSPTLPSREDSTVHEEFPTPDAPRLAPADGGVKAFVGRRAQIANGFRSGDLAEVLGEKQRRQRAGTVVATGRGEPLGLTVIEEGGGVQGNRAFRDGSGD